MTITKTISIASATILLVAAMTLAIVHATDITARVSYHSPISTDGNIHGPQTLTTTYQQADNPVITFNPQAPTVSDNQLQAATAKIQ